jgi:hypothetical protein
MIQDSEISIIIQSLKEQRPYDKVLYKHRHLV